MPADTAIKVLPRIHMRRRSSRPKSRPMRKTRTHMAQGLKPSTAPIMMVNRGRETLPGVDFAKDRQGNGFRNDLFGRDGWASLGGWPDCRPGPGRGRQDTSAPLPRWRRRWLVSSSQPMKYWSPITVNGTPETVTFNWSATFWRSSWFSGLPLIS